MKPTEKVKNIGRAVAALLICACATAALILGGRLLDTVGRLTYPRMYASEVAAASAEFGVPEPLIYAVIRTESGFDPSAVSHKGAAGLMQLMPATAEYLFGLLGVENEGAAILSPALNIRAGTLYLSQLLDRYENLTYALAAYNAGEGRVDRWIADSDGGDFEIPFRETARYVRRVVFCRTQYIRIYYN